MFFVTLSKIIKKKFFQSIWIGVLRVTQECSFFIIMIVIAIFYADSVYFFLGGTVK